MNETVREWVAKANRDLATARRESQATDDPNHDAVCFHSQQSIEKLLKALLIERGSPAPRLHDLPELGRLVGAVCPDWSWPVDELRFLSRAAVEFRYPGESATRDDAARCLDIATHVGVSLLPLLQERPEEG
jgi:HEPN domain-containing protein